MANRTTRIKNAQAPRNVIYDLTPQVDGRTQTFTLEDKVYDQDSHYLLFNGQECRNDATHLFYDISNDGRTLTTHFDFPPIPGAKHSLQFIKSDNADGTADFVTEDQFAALEARVAALERAIANE